MDNTALLMSGVLWSSIGMGYFIYGKKSSHMIALISGIILMVVPYFITNVIYMFVLGILCLLLPYFFKI